MPSIVDRTNPLSLCVQHATLLQPQNWTSGKSGPSLDHRALCANHQCKTQGASVAQPMLSSAMLRHLLRPPCKGPVQHSSRHWFGVHLQRHGATDLVDRILSAERCLLAQASNQAAIGMGSMLSTALVAQGGTHAAIVVGSMLSTVVPLT